MRKRWWIVALAAVVALVVAGGAVWYFVFRDDAPAEVSIDRATRALDDEGSGTTATSGSAEVTTRGSTVDGTWAVDPTKGSFSDFTSSFAGFRVQEQLVGIGAKTAVGRTPDVTGDITILNGVLTTATFEVDMTTLTTDDGRRDNAIRTQAIETARFPKATFVLTQPISLGSIPADGQKIEIDAIGDLTLHGVTKRITVPLQAERNGDVITVVGSLEIPFSDYSISQPRAASVLSVEDKGVFEVQLHLTRTT
jgi:polyisoprenoid-binding protein YceI